ncbi:hypothetical protein [Flavilitoribacter nigricans]|uniref:DUF4890 domain-containing protein n=1 Tax=Flavilitoribacter nigricans (strain ATCC 23147 / DSM 23189 / NBRC 102662 / NCIMB 1420 / SS-2) TaxID=1122177 RepID=A0A2D0NB50_FLAN2|nr:hypothetical protein [Flavilitoribacter nigricans]PHN04993.1 hypothetical protein CRP01_18355 [Flavilitoribacter nigricans DSM 23189 = NBRC 102662]
MKSTKKVILAATLFLMMGLSVSAQSRKAAERPRLDPEKETTQLVEKLDLSQKQADKVKKINQDFAKKMEQARTAKEDGRPASRETMAQLHREKTDKMKAVLSKKQYEAYEKVYAEKGKQMRQKATGEKHPAESKTRTGTRR